MPARARTDSPWLGAAAVIIAGAALRFWQLARSGWQYDEIVYWQVASSILHGGGLTEHITYGAHWTPFLYQPPWYPYALSGWFTVFGPTIYSARVLGVLCSVGTLFLAWRLVARLRGPQAAVFALVPIAFDGWCLYIQRISYIENIVLLAVTAAFLLYQRAMDAPGWQRFAVAGMVLGAAGCLKYTGLYAVVAMGLCWLIQRRQHVGHAVLLATVVAVIAVDQVVLIAWFGHSYIQQTSLQGRRVVGLQPSGGSLTSPSQLAHLLAAQYHVFAPSLLIAIAGLVIAVRRLLGCYRDRDWRALRPQAVLFSWAAAAVLIFGFSNLRYPQYFALVLLPLYLLWWTEVWGWDRPLKLKLALAGTAALAGVISFGLSTTAQSGNPLAQVRQYAARYIPAKAVVVADEMTGDLIAQPYCREQAAAPCLHHASYAITWTTYLQSTSQLGDAAYRAEMHGAVPVASWTGFNGTATVWKLRTGPSVGVDVEADSDYPEQDVSRYGQRVMAYISRSLDAQDAGIVWDLCSPGRHSDTVSRNCTLTPAAVRTLATQAARDGLGVQLRPIIRVGPRSGWNDPAVSWEGSIRPANQRGWFASLLAAERPYLEILRSIPGSEFVAGTELDGVASSPQWTSFIHQAQAICGCQVSVSAFDHQYARGIVPPVLNPGVDWYPHLDLRATAPQSTVTAAWKSSLARIPRPLLERTSLDEEGIRGTAGAYRHPEEWGISGPADPEVQARYFTAACQAASYYHMTAIYFYEIPLADNPSNPSKFPAFFVGNVGASAIRACADRA